MKDTYWCTKNEKDELREKILSANFSFKQNDSFNIIKWIKEYLVELLKK